jgi:hypothetical protein
MKITLRKNLTLGLIGLFSLLMAGQSQALTVGDVGTLDNLLDSTLLENSGDAEELAYIESVVGTAVTLVDKVDYDEATIGDYVLEVTDDAYADSYAIAIDDTTDYYLIKIGCGTGCTADTYLFENLEELTYAYFTLTQLNIGEILTISHITTAAVPVPAAAWLFGSALLGLVGVARRRT